MAGAFAMGFDSAIATTLNFLPQYAVGIQKAIRENRVQEARKLQESLSDAADVITRDGKTISFYFHKINKVYIMGGVQTLQQPGDQILES